MQKNIPSDMVSSGGYPLCVCGGSRGKERMYLQEDLRSVLLFGRVDRVYFIVIIKGPLNYRNLYYGGGIGI